ncbi:MAG TPA: thioredoxin family protein [Chitinophagaceae bacterium]|jgi:thioredoxin-related protein
MSKKTLVIIVLLGFLNLTYAQEKGIRFEQSLSWKQIFAKAKEEHKYIFVDCYASWCGPCKLMDKDTYPNDSVGKVMTASFLSVKVQCDITKQDDQHIKDWYTDAHQIQTTYGIHEYPTFLFFSPNGDLVYKAVGYRNPRQFLALAHDARDFRKQYPTLVATYHAGKLPYSGLLDLIKFAGLLHDTITRSAAARDYIHEYLDRLPGSAWKNKENGEALGYISRYLRTEDQTFRQIWRDPKMIDSVTGIKGMAMSIINDVIYREEIEPAVTAAKKSGDKPTWDSLQKKVKMRFGTNYANMTVASGRFDWFSFKNDWENYAGALIDMITAYGWDPKDESTRLSFNWAANEIFLKSNDPTKLSIAAEWMDPVVASTKTKGYYAGEFLDTKANILYKLGRKEAAIELQEEAVQAYPEGNDIRENLEKMKAGKPTWPNK